MNDRPTYEQLEKRVRELEHAIKTTEQHLHEIINFLPDATFAINNQGKVIAWNRAIQEMTGIKAGDMLGKGNYAYAIPFYGDRRPVLIDLVGEWDEKIRKKYRYVKEDGDSLVSETYDSLVKPDGYLWNKASLLHDSNGKTIGAIESIRDVTEHRIAESERKQSEQKYRNILESIEEGYYEVDTAGNFTFVNQSACRILGYPEKELIGTNNQQYMNKKNAAKLKQIFHTVYTTKVPARQFNLTIIRKNGEKSHLETSIAVVEDGRGERTGFRGILRDITEKRTLEAKLNHVRRTESIATLAGGIAHEFNNTLMGITGNIELLQMEMDEKGKKHKRLDLMKISALRMANLTKQLLAYAKGGKYRPKVISLNTFIKETLPLQKQAIRSITTLRTDLQSNIPHVKIDFAQMQMVFSAILANADEAAKGEGHIKITTKSVAIDKEFVKNHPDFVPGHYVCLTVEDHGKGMDSETLTKLFDPFFTTKFQGRGLGMAAVYGIIRNHKGSIFVDSKPNQGTVVRIYLPVAETALKDTKAPAGDLETGTKTILIIEDEDMVIEITQTLLERLGYQVKVASTGKEAIHMTKTFDGNIDLALLDIKLPDIEGGNLYPLLMKTRPDLKVIVCSGYSKDGPAQEIISAGAQDFMQKPFSLATLRDKLKKALEE